jgi:plastocyanin
MSTITQRHASGTGADAAPRRPGDRFVGTVLFLKAAVLLGYQPLAGEYVPALLVLGGLFLVLGLAVVRRAPRWLLILVAVLVVLDVAGSSRFLVANIQHPESMLSFLVDAFSMIASAAVLAGVAVALRSGDPSGSRRRIALVAGVLATVAVVASVTAATRVSADPVQPGDVEVTVSRFQFPDTVTVPAAGAVLWIDNRDPVRHTLVVDGTAVHVELPASTSRRVTVDLTPGTHRYFCDVPGHERMEGTLHVR